MKKKAKRKFAKRIIGLISVLLLIVFIFGACSATENTNYYVRTMSNHSYSDYSLDFLINEADKIVYAEILSREADSELFGIYHNGTYYDDVCLTNVKIKVHKNFKGANESTLTYREIGGQINDTLYFKDGENCLNIGDRAVLFLSENNMLIGIKDSGCFKETADNEFYVKKALLENYTKDYNKNFLSRAKLNKEDFFAFLETEVANISASSGEKDENFIAFTESLHKPNELISFYQTNSLAVYGEVTKVNEPDIYDFTYDAGRVFINEFYIKSNVEIKVIDKIWGDCGDCVTYCQPGGEKNGKVYEFNALEKLKEGDKVIIFLSESNSVRYGNGLLKLNENGEVEVFGKVLKAEDFIKEIKNKLPAMKEAVKEEDEELRKRSRNPSSADSCYAEDTTKLKYILENTDIILKGKAQIGSSDIYYTAYFNKNRTPTVYRGTCYTEINLSNAVCYYNRYSGTDINEITYLQQGGEIDGYTFPKGGFTIDKDCEVIVFLKFDGANYRAVYQTAIPENGKIVVPTDILTKEYLEKYKENKTAENYLSIIASLLNEIE